MILSDCNKINVYCTYAHDYRTWNVIHADSHELLFYGSIFELEEWLVENSSSHRDMIQLVL
jgi:hypothetical protein